jgi:hypothetical protein
LFSGALAASPARASSTSLRGPVPVVVANEHGVPGAVAVANDRALADKVFYSLLSRPEQGNVPAARLPVACESRVIR